MSLDAALEAALGTVLAQVDEDHHRVAAALLGVEGLAPEDADLAALFASIVAAGSGCSLLDLAETHPEAVARQIGWATGAWDPTAFSADDAADTAVSLEVTYSLVS